MVTWPGHEKGEFACAVIRQLKIDTEAVTWVRSAVSLTAARWTSTPRLQNDLRVALRAAFGRLGAAPGVGGTLFAGHQASVQPQASSGSLIQTPEAMLQSRV